MRRWGGFSEATGLMGGRAMTVSILCTSLTAGRISPYSLASGTFLVCPVYSNSNCMSALQWQWNPHRDLFFVFRPTWCQSLCSLSRSCLRCQPQLWKSFLTQLLSHEPKRFLFLLFSVFQPLHSIMSLDKKAKKCYRVPAWHCLGGYFVHFYTFMLKKGKSHFSPYFIIISHSLFINICTCNLHQLCFFKFYFI